MYDCPGLESQAQDQGYQTPLQFQSESAETGRWPRRNTHVRFEEGNETEVMFLLFLLPGTVVGAFVLTFHSKHRVILKRGNIQSEINRVS